MSSIFRSAFSGRSAPSETGSVSGRSSSHRKKSRSERGDDDTQSVVSSASRKHGEGIRHSQSSRYDDGISPRTSVYGTAPSLRANEPRGLTESAVRALAEDDDWEDDDRDAKSGRRSKRGDEHEHRRKHRSDRSERSRSRSRDRDGEKRKKSTITSEKPRGKSRVEERADDRGSSRAIPSMGSMQQFPGMYDASVVGPPEHKMSGALPYDSHVGAQFPGQQANLHDYIKPDFAPVDNPHGAAADYYNDRGESVKLQPGIRPNTPMMLHNPDPHLMSASAVAVPAQDTGHGSAADFYGGRGSPTASAQDTPQKPPRPGRAPSSGGKQPSSASKPSRAPFGTTAAVTTAALGSAAAAGYAVGSSSNQYSQDQTSSSTSYYQQGNNPPSTSQAPPSSIATGAFKPTRHNSEPSVSASGYYGAPPAVSGKSGRSPSSTNNAAFYAAGGAAVAGLAAHEMNQHHQHHQSENFTSTSHYGTPPQYPPRAPLGAANSSYMNGGGNMQWQQQYHEHRGPITRLKDGLLNLVSSPEDVARMEEYTEYIGVCKHCFDPRSRPGDAPRPHHYHGPGRRDSFESMRRRTSIERMRKRSSRESLGRTGSTRIEKSSRYYSSGDEKRRKGGGLGVLGAGAAAVGAGMAANALFNDRKDFDDTYSVKSGHRASSAARRRSRSSSRERRRRSSHGVVGQLAEVEYVTVKLRDGTIEKRRVHHRSRSGSRDRKSGALYAASGAALGGAAIAGASRHSRDHSPQSAFIRRHTSRSRSRSSSDEKRRRRSRRSPNGSYYDISRSNRPSSPQGIFGGFFSPSSSSKRRRSPRHEQRRKQKKTGFFNFGNGSSSSSGSEMAFGEGFASRSSLGKVPSAKRKPSKKSSDDHLAATMLGIGATAAALSAAQRGNRISKRPSKPELVARRDARARQHAHPSHQHGPAEDEDWEDELPSDDASSISSGLAFGGDDRRLSHRQSRESITSQSSAGGLGAWGWRWGGKKEKKKRRNSSPPPAYPPRPDSSYAGPVAAGMAAGAALDAYGRPLPYESHATSTTSIPQAPMQYVDPRPVSETPSQSGSRHASMPGAFDSPIVARPGPAPIQQPQPITPVQPAFTQAPYESMTATADDRPHMPRRTQSSPTQSGWKDAALIGGAALATAGIIASSSGRRSKEPSNVRFGLTDEQQKKHDREVRRERERVDEERRRADRTRALKEEADRHAREEDDRRSREAHEREVAAIAAADEQRRIAAKREAEEQAELDRQKARESREREEAYRREQARSAEETERRRVSEHEASQQVELDRQREQARLAEDARQEEQNRRQREEMAAREEAERRAGDQDRVRKIQREEDLQAEVERKQRELDQPERSERSSRREARRERVRAEEEEQARKSSSAWAAPVAGVAGAMVGSVLAGREHEHEPDRDRTADGRPHYRADTEPTIDHRDEWQEKHEREHRPNIRTRESYEVKPTDEHHGEPVMDDDIFDPDFFKRKRTNSEADRYRQAADKVISDLEDRYSTPAQTQADFFAPKELLAKTPEGKTAVADPIDDNDVQVYHEAETGSREHFPASDAKFGDYRAAAFARDNIPRLNVIAPTPPQSAAGSVRGDRSAPPSPLAEPHDKESEVQPEPEREPEPKRRSASRTVSWGQDIAQTHVYDAQTPESYHERDAYIADKDIPHAASTPLDEVVVEPASPGTETEHHPASELPRDTTPIFDDVEDIAPEPDSEGFTYKRPFFDPTSDIGFAMDSPGTEGAPRVKGWVEGETDEPTPAQTPASEKAPHIPGGFSDTEDDMPRQTAPRDPSPRSIARENIRRQEEADRLAQAEDLVGTPRTESAEPSWEPPLSKKDKKKREKATRRSSTMDSESTTPAATEVELPPSVPTAGPDVEPADYFMSKKDKKKRDKAAKRSSTIDSEPTTPAATEPEPLPSVITVEPESEPVEYFMSKKDKKKRDKTAKRSNTFDSEPTTPAAVEPEPEPLRSAELDSEPADYFPSKKDKKSREKAAKRGLSDDSSPVTPISEQFVTPAESAPIVEEPAVEEPAWEPPLSKKEQKKREKEARQQGLANVAAAAMTAGGIAAVANAAEDEEEIWSASSKKSKKGKRKSADVERDIRDIEPPGLTSSVSVADAPAFDTPEFATAVARSSDPDPSQYQITDESSSPREADPYTEYAEPKKSKKKKKRDSDRFNSPAAASPLRSEVAFDDYIGGRSAHGQEPPAISDLPPMANGHAKEHVAEPPISGPLAAEAEEASGDRASRGPEYFDDDRRMNGSPPSMSPDDTRSIASAPGGERRRSKSAKTRRDSDFQDDPYAFDNQSVAVSEPADIYESSKKSKRRSMHDDDDTASIVSSRSRRELEESSSAKKDKRGGILGLFSRKSAEKVPTSRSSTHDGKDNDGEEGERRHRKKKHSTSEYGEDDDTRSITSESRRRRHRDQDDREEDSRERHRRRQHDDDEDDRASRHGIDSGPRHHHRHRSGETNGDDISSTKDQSFLGMRVEDLPPLPASLPASPVTAPFEEEQDFGIPVSAKPDVDRAISGDIAVPVQLQELEPLLPAGSVGESEQFDQSGKHDKPESDRGIGENIAVPIQLQEVEPLLSKDHTDEFMQTLDQPSTHRDPEDRDREYVVESLPTLPESRPDSPTELLETPLRPPPSARHASSTAVPLRFRQPPFSPKHQRDRSASFSSPVDATPASPASAPKLRTPRPTSLEFRHSHEFRPLYLVERNTKTPEVEDLLPSLPSSKPSSRASSLHGSEDYQSALEDIESPKQAKGLFIDMDRANNYQSNEDVLDDEQTTPKASDFPQTAFARLPRQEPQYYTWEDLAQDERLHDAALAQDRFPLPASAGTYTTGDTRSDVKQEPTSYLDNPTPSSRSRSASPFKGGSPSRRSHYKGLAAAAMLGGAAALVAREAHKKDAEAFSERHDPAQTTEVPVNPIEQLETTGGASPPASLEKAPTYHGLLPEEALPGQHVPDLVNIHAQSPATELSAPEPEPLRPTLSRKSSSKKAGKRQRKKSDQADTDSATVTEVEATPLTTVVSGDQAAGPTADEDDDDWFTAGPVSKGSKKKGKKGKKQPDVRVSLEPVSSFERGTQPEADAMETANIGATSNIAPLDRQEPPHIEDAHTDRFADLDNEGADRSLRAQPPEADEVALNVSPAESSRRDRDAFLLSEDRMEAGAAQIGEKQLKLGLDHHPEAVSLETNGQPPDGINADPLVELTEHELPSSQSGTRTLSRRGNSSRHVQTIEQDVAPTLTRKQSKKAKKQQKATAWQEINEGLPSQPDNGADTQIAADEVRAEGVPAALEHPQDIAAVEAGIPLESSTAPREQPPKTLAQTSPAADKAVGSVEGSTGTRDVLAVQDAVAQPMDAEPPTNAFELSTSKKSKKGKRKQQRLAAWDNPTEESDRQDVLDLEPESAAVNLTGRPASAQEVVAPPLDLLPTQAELMSSHSLENAPVSAIDEVPQESLLAASNVHGQSTDLATNMERGHLELRDYERDHAPAQEQLSFFADTARLADDPAPADTEHLDLGKTAQEARVPVVEDDVASEDPEKEAPRSWFPSWFSRSKKDAKQSPPDNTLMNEATMPADPVSTLPTDNIDPLEDLPTEQATEQPDFEAGATGAPARPDLVALPESETRSAGVAVEADELEMARTQSIPRNADNASNAAVERSMPAQSLPTDSHDTLLDVVEPSTASEHHTDADVPPSPQQTASESVNGSDRAPPVDDTSVPKASEFERTNGESDNAPTTEAENPSWLSSSRKKPKKGRKGKQADQETAADPVVSPITYQASMEPAALQLDKRPPIDIQSAPERGLATTSLEPNADVAVQSPKRVTEASEDTASAKLVDHLDLQDKQMLREPAETHPTTDIRDEQAHDSVGYPASDDLPENAKQLEAGPRQSELAVAAESLAAVGEESQPLEPASMFESSHEEGRTEARLPPPIHEPLSADEFSSGQISDSASKHVDHPDGVQASLENTEVDMPNIESPAAVVEPQEAESFWTPQPSRKKSKKAKKTAELTTLDSTGEVASQDSDVPLANPPMLAEQLPADSERDSQPVMQESEDFWTPLPAKEKGKKGKKGALATPIEFNNFVADDTSSSQAEIIEANQNESTIQHPSTEDSVPTDATTRADIAEVEPNTFWTPQSSKKKKGKTGKRSALSTPPVLDDLPINEPSLSEARDDAVENETRTDALPAEPLSEAMQPAEAEIRADPTDQDTEAFWTPPTSKKKGKKGKKSALATPVIFDEPVQEEASPTPASDTAAEKQLSEEQPDRHDGSSAKGMSVEDFPPEDVEGSWTPKPSKKKGKKGKRSTAQNFTSFEDLDIDESQPPRTLEETSIEIEHARDPLVPPVEETLHHESESAFEAVPSVLDVPEENKEAKALSASEGTAAASIAPTETDQPPLVQGPVEQLPAAADAEHGPSVVATERPVQRPDLRELVANEDYMHPIQDEQSTQDHHDRQSPMFGAAENAVPDTEHREQEQPEAFGPDTGRITSEGAVILHSAANPLVEPAADNEEFSTVPTSEKGKKGKKAKQSDFEEFPMPVSSELHKSAGDARTPLEPDVEASAPHASEHISVAVDESAVDEPVAGELDLANLPVHEPIADESVLPRDTIHAQAVEERVDHSEAPPHHEVNGSEDQGIIAPELQAEEHWSAPTNKKKGKKAKRGKQSAFETSEEAGESAIELPDFGSASVPGQSENIPQHDAAVPSEPTGVVDARDGEVWTPQLKKGKKGKKGKQIEWEDPTDNAGYFEQVAVPAQDEEAALLRQELSQVPEREAESFGHDLARSPSREAGPTAVVLDEPVVPQAGDDLQQSSQAEADEAWAMPAKGKKGKKGKKSKQMGFEESTLPIQPVLDESVQPQDVQPEAPASTVDTFDPEVIDNARQAAEAEAHDVWSMPAKGRKGKKGKKGKQVESEGSTTPAELVMDNVAPTEDFQPDLPATSLDTGRPEDIDDPQPAIEADAEEMWAMSARGKKGKKGKKAKQDLAFEDEPPAERPEVAIEHVADKVPSVAEPVAQPPSSPAEEPQVEAAMMPAEHNEAVQDHSAAKSISEADTRDRKSESAAHPHDLVVQREDTEAHQPPPGPSRVDQIDDMVSLRAGETQRDLDDLLTKDVAKARAYAAAEPVSTAVASEDESQMTLDLNETVDTPKSSTLPMVQQDLDVRESPTQHANAASTAADEYVERPLSPARDFSYQAQIADTQSDIDQPVTVGAADDQRDMARFDALAHESTVGNHFTDQDQTEDPESQPPIVDGIPHVAQDDPANAYSAFTTMKRSNKDKKRGKKVRLAESEPELPTSSGEALRSVEDGEKSTEGQIALEAAVATSAAAALLATHEKAPEEPEEDPWAETTVGRSKKESKKKKGRKSGSITTSYQAEAIAPEPLQHAPPIEPQPEQAGTAYAERAILPNAEQSASFSGPDVERDTDLLVEERDSNEIEANMAPGDAMLHNNDYLEQPIRAQSTAQQDYMDILPVTHNLQAGDPHEHDTEVTSEHEQHQPFDRDAGVASSKSTPPSPPPRQMSLSDSRPDDTNDSAAPKQSQDIDFAATLAAGLSDTGFDPSLVVNDPIFHRRASPPGGVAEADPEEVFNTTTTKRGKKGKKGRRSEHTPSAQASFQTEQSDRVLQEPQGGEDFDATLSRGLQYSGFDAALLQNAVAPEKELSATQLDAEPEEFAFAQPKRKKGKKGKSAQVASEEPTGRSPLDDTVVIDDELNERSGFTIPEQTQREHANVDPATPHATTFGTQDRLSLEQPAIVENTATQHDAVPEILEQQDEATVATVANDVQRDSGESEEARHVTAEEPTDVVTLPEETSGNTWALPSFSKKKGKKGKKQFEDAATPLQPSIGEVMGKEPSRRDDSPPSMAVEADPADTLIMGGDEMDVDDMDKAYRAYKKSKRKQKKQKAAEAQQNVGLEADQTEDTTIAQSTATVSGTPDSHEAFTPSVARETTLDQPSETVTATSEQPRAAEAHIDQQMHHDRSPINPASKIGSVFPGLERIKRRAHPMTTTNEEPALEPHAASESRHEGFLHTSEVSQSLPLKLSRDSSPAYPSLAEGESTPIEEAAQDSYSKPDSGDRERTPKVAEHEYASDAPGLGLAGAAVAAAGFALGSQARDLAEGGNTKEAASSRVSQQQQGASRDLAPAEPAWSFASLSDAEQPLPESPVLGTRKHQVVRDSGYHEPDSPLRKHHSVERSSRDMPKIRAVASGESLRSRRSAEPLHIDTDTGSEWELSNPKRRSGDSQLHAETHARTPSNGTPLEPTTKNRASYLFQSPPPNLADVRDTLGPATPGQRSEASDYFRSRSLGGSISDTGRAAEPTANGNALSPSPMGPMSPRLDTIPEESHATKRSIGASNVGPPDRERKALRRTETPQAFRERTLSPPTRPSVTIPSETARAASDLLSPEQAVNRTTSPSVDDNHSTTRSDRSLKRKSEKRVLSDTRSPSVVSSRSNNSATYYKSPEDHRSFSRTSNRSATPTLRRKSLSGDLRAASRASSKRGDSGSAVGARSSPKTIPFEPPPTPPSNDEDVVHPSASRAADMAEVGDVFVGSAGIHIGNVDTNAQSQQGYGDAQRSQASPTRPPSMRKRQSMHIMELEGKLDQLVAENRALHDAKMDVEQSREATSYQQDADAGALRDAIEERDLKLREKDYEISQIRAMLEPMQSEINRLHEINGGLTEANKNLVDDTNGRYATLQQEHAHAHDQWQSASRELNNMREEHGRLNAGMKGIVETEIASALADKNTEIRRLREELEIATERIRALQVQIQSSKKSDFLTTRDEDYFDGACQKLCQHVQQWVLRFSKVSDNRICRLSTDLQDEKIEARLDNAVLDGSDVDKLLGDRVKRRDVFMSVVMTMVWEYVFTRYLFGMDREQRQKLKALEKILAEVGPPRAVAQWRATTLTLLSRRPSFASQCTLDTEAVAHEVFGVLCALLQPPTSAESQLMASLQKVIGVAVDLSIEMRTQRAEYIMLPPLQPEYDTNGDLVRKVHFNASLMNERSGMFSTNEELETDRAIVKIVLFPLVVKKGNEVGEGEEEIVVCPAQVLVHNDNGKGKKIVRVMSGAMEIDDPRRSRQSLVSTAPGSTAY